MLKSLIAKPSDNVRVMRDFWRGMWDGDGNIQQGNKCPDIGIIGSFAVLNAFCEFIGPYIPDYPLQPRNNRGNNGTATIRLHGAGAMRVLEVLYKDATVYLDRKYFIAMELLEKYKDKKFRIFEEGIHKETSFPYSYTDMKRAFSDFDKLKKVTLDECLSCPLRHNERDVVNHVLNKKIIGMYASHYFNETHRMKVRVQGSNKSPIETWENEDVRAKIIEEATVGKHSNLRAAMHANCRAAWGFSPAIARAIYLFFNAKKILDPCAGWGDRLTGALSIPDCHYVGVDPNSSLVKMYSQIRHAYQGQDRSSVITCAFEDAALDNDFDLSFTSPPYYNWERYSDDADQSYIRYSTPEEWRDGFLSCLVNKSTRHLKKKGVLAVNIGNVPDGDGNRLPLVSWLSQIAKINADLRYIGCFTMDTGNLKPGDEGIYCWEKQ